MLVVTTPTVEGAPVKQYIGMVSGEAISGVNMFKDFGANLSNMFGGRASQYEEEIGGVPTRRCLRDRRQRNVRPRPGHGCQRGRRRKGRLLHRRRQQRHACRHRDGHRRHPLTRVRVPRRARLTTRQGRTKRPWRVVAMLSRREREVSSTFRLHRPRAVSDTAFSSSPNRPYLIHLVKVVVSS